MEFKLRSSDLHETIIAAVLHADTDGHTLQFTDIVAGVDDDIEPGMIVLADVATRRSRLAAQRAEIRRRLDVAVEAHTNARPEVAERYGRRVDELADQLAQLDARLAEVGTPSDCNYPPEITIRFDHVLKSLAHLRTPDGKIEATLAAKLRSVIRNLQVRPHDDRTARVTFDLWLPGREHLVVVADVAGFCPALQAGERYARHRADHRRRSESEVLEAIRDGQGADGIHEMFGGQRNSNVRYGFSLLRSAYPKSSVCWRRGALYHPIRAMGLAAAEFLEQEQITGIDETAATRLKAGLERLGGRNYREL